MRKGGMLTTVITGTTVAGVSMVIISGDRTQLTFGGVQREVSTQFERQPIFPGPNAAVHTNILPFEASIIDLLVVPKQ